MRNQPSKRLHRVLLVSIIALQGAAGAAALEAHAEPPTTLAAGADGDIRGLAAALPAAEVEDGLAAPPSTTVETAPPAPPTTVAPPPTVGTAPPPPPAPATTAPPPSTTTSSAPPPSPATTAPSHSAPATRPNEPTEPSESLEARVERSFVTGVPDAWRAAIAVRLEVIDGTTSWAHGSGVISIARSHASGNFDHLVDVVAHEFGHLIAFEYGTKEYAGAAPEGWPAPPERPEEAWADCVQRVFTGRNAPSHGLGPCVGEQLSWADQWLAAGPPDR